MQDRYLKKLDEIIMSDDVVDLFYEAYNNDIEFKVWLDKEIPYFKLCEERTQNNPWHRYNVLGHILHSVQEMNLRTKNLDENERRMLAYVMLFHDMGKPEKHIERIKDRKKIDSFFGHNIRSAEIAKELLPKLNFSEKEAKIIDKLVLKHDIFMFIKEFPTNNPYWRTLTHDLVQEEIKDLNSVGDGKKLLRYLVLVGRCDNLAQNEKMTKDSLKMLDKFDAMLDGYQ